jgi:hypothetical protein
MVVSVQCTGGVRKFGNRPAIPMKIRQIAISRGSDHDDAPHRKFPRRFPEITREPVTGRSAGELSEQENGTGQTAGPR